MPRLPGCCPFGLGQAMLCSTGWLQPPGCGGRLPCLNPVSSFPGTLGSLELLHAFHGTLILKNLPRSPLETLEMGRGGGWRLHTQGTAGRQAGSCVFGRSPACWVTTVCFLFYSPADGPPQRALGLLRPALACFVGQSRREERLKPGMPPLRY